MLRLERQLGDSSSLTCGKARKALIKSLLGYSSDKACGKATKAAWTF